MSDLVDVIFAGRRENGEMGGDLEGPMGRLEGRRPAWRFKWMGRD